MKTQETLESLGLTPSETAVYMAMVEGKMKVKDIMNVTGLKRPSVYYAIDRLEERGLLGRMQVGSYNQWQLSPSSALQALVEKKKMEVQELETEVRDLAESIDAVGAAAAGTEVTFYEGQKAVEGVVFNALYTKKKEILSIAPDGNFFQQTGSAFALRFVQERQQRGIDTRHLWESQGPVSADDLQKYYPDTSKIRILPEQMKEAFATTVFIYDDTVMYVSSKRSGYAVVFKSAEHAELQRAIFNTLWSVGSQLETV